MFEITNPLYRNGRWYEAFITSDGTSLTVEQSDVKDILVKEKSIAFPENFHVIEAYTDYATKPGKSGSLHPTISVDTKGRQCVSIASAGLFEEVHIYVFGHQK